MPQQTPLYSLHLKHNAKMVDFAGWDMPIHYGSQIEEHHSVRTEAGIFDVSHMCVIDLTGHQTPTFLRHLLANDINKLKIPGKALYSCMLNESAGIIDDLIVYWLGEQNYRLVVNAGTREKDLVWIRQQAKTFSVSVTERKDLGILAVQGPHAREKVHTLFAHDIQNCLAELKPFQGITVHEMWIARTGYTGEDGYEMLIPQEQLSQVWNNLLEKGVKPCGLGARDTLRLEAGLNLYGSDMDETTHPLESNLAWTVAFEDPTRNFIGRKALENIQTQDSSRQLVGLILEERGIMRSHQQVYANNSLIGEITSGTFSPTLEKSIAMARIQNHSYDSVEVDIRGKKFKAKVVKPCFVRHGKAV